ncbi:MAG: DUF1217 domain-containing protein, partial [Alphaproteobacteria bacterium]|nr:DUF1217 domain-containing protein [Alphaproteobacteria bacterium]
GGQIALALFGTSPTSTSGSTGSGFPGGSIAYYNYLAKNGSALLKQSNNSQAVASAVAYFQSRVAQVTPAKPTTLVRISANLPSTDFAGQTHTMNATVFDNKGDKFTVGVKFTNLGPSGNTNSWIAQIVSATAAQGNPNPNVKANVTSGSQTLTFDSTTGQLLQVAPGPGSATSGVGLGVITTSDNQVLKPVFSFAGGGTTGGNLTDTTSFYQVNAVQSNGNPAVAGANNIKTVNDIFNDPKLLNFILTATGLGDQTQNLGLVKKALTQDPTKPGSIAGQLNNPKFVAAAQTLQLFNGLSALQSPTVIQALIAGYQTNTFEVGIAQTDQNVADARYFAQNIANTVSSATTKTNAALSILGDSVLRQVVSTALGFPPQLAVLPVQDQAIEIMNRVDVNQFKNPQFVAQFVTRYLTQVQIAANNADLGSSGDVALSTLSLIQTPPRNFR